jgi:hypothetical protein
VAKAVGIKDLQIHDLRHFTASTLTCVSVEDNIISLLRVHKSRELRGYQKCRTGVLIAKALQEAENYGLGQKGPLLHRARKSPKACRRITVSY